MDSIGFNTNFNVEKYINIYKNLKKYNDGLNNFLKKQNESHIFTINGIDISTIYIKYFDLINSNTLYFVTKYRNKTIFYYYYSKLNGDYNKNNKLILYKSNFIDYFIFEQAVRNIYKCIQPNLCYIFINLSFSKLYVMLKYIAKKSGENFVHSFVGLISSFTGPFISFIIHYCVELIGSIIDLVINNKPINLSNMLTDAFKGLILAGQYTLLEKGGFSKIVNFMTGIEFLQLLFGIIYDTYKEIKDTIYRNKEQLNKYLIRLTQYNQKAIIEKFC
jgi:hypothetical protein